MPFGLPNAPSIFQKADKLVVYFIIWSGSSKRLTKPCLSPIFKQTRLFCDTCHLSGQVGWLVVVFIYKTYIAQVLTKSFQMRITRIELKIPLKIMGHQL